MNKTLCFAMVCCFLGGGSGLATGVVGTAPSVVSETKGAGEQALEETIKEMDKRAGTSVEITVKDRVFSAIFYDTPVSNALISHMPFTVEMKEFAAQEKVGVLPYDLPSEQTQTPATVERGGLYLWSGNQLVLFYETISNNYAYVPLGQIEDISGLEEALGSGNVGIGFEAGTAVPAR